MSRSQPLFLFFCRLFSHVLLFPFCWPLNKNILGFPMCLGHSHFAVCPHICSVFLFWLPFQITCVDIHNAPRSQPFLCFSVVFLTCTPCPHFSPLKNDMLVVQMRLGHSPFYVFLLCLLTCTPFPLLFPLEIEHQCVLFSDSGTVEAGAGAGGEGVKRKRSDDMAALEADLAPEPQAGMTQSPASVSSPHLYQRSLPL